MRVPVLTYHGVNIGGNDYARNDHVAFRADLRLINELGLRIVPLSWLVEQLLAHTQRDLSRCVALSCDDGADFDYFDLDHPRHGRQRSLFNCLLDFRHDRGATAQPNLHLTSFVIASPQARVHLDRTSLAGRGWMRDVWWRSACASGLMAIENHSWDHNHPGIPGLGIDGMTRGSFHPVDNRTRAEAQIAQATRFINDLLAPRRTTLFCYPYSQANDYLRTEYLPRHQDEHGMLAAFGDGAAPVTLDSDRWLLPRYICGWHWKSSDELRALLRDSH